MDLMLFFGGVAAGVGAVTAFVVFWPRKPPARQKCWYAQRGRWEQDQGRGGKWRMKYQPPEVIRGEHPADYIARHIGPK